MTPEELKQQVRQITVWKRGGQRAVHKPLLLLYALSRCLNEGRRLLPYHEVDRDLRELLTSFGPPRKSCHTEYPFWRLQNDGIWTLTNTDQVQTRQSNNDAKKSELLKYAVHGGFTEPVFAVLQSSPTLVTELAVEMLFQHFQPSFFQDLLESIGLHIRFDHSLRRRRDPAFRDRILTAYEFRCAICGYDVRLGSQQLALEAAHIKWHQAGGPDTERNGLALCSMHHKLFDRGALTISGQQRVAVSQRTNGSHGLSEWLMAFHGQPLRTPQSNAYAPDEEFISWHQREVFQGPAREIAN